MFNLSYQYIFIEHVMDNIINYLKKEGVKFFTVIGRKVYRSIINFKSDYTFSCKENFLTEIYVNCIFNKNIHSFKFEIIDSKLVLKNLEDSLKRLISKVGVESKVTKFPRKVLEYKEPVDIYYPKEIDIKKSLNFVNELISKLSNESKISEIYGFLESILSREVIKTSNGDYCEERKTNFKLSVECSIKKHLTRINMNKIATSLSKLNITELTRETNFLLSLSPTNNFHVESGKYNVLLHPQAYGYLIGSFSRFFSLHYVMRGLSPFVNKLNQVIASKNINLRDYPLQNGNPGAKVFNELGEQTKNVYIVKSGILNSYLSNWLDSVKYNVKSTGHSILNKSIPYSVIIDGVNTTNSILDLKDCNNVIFLTNLNGLQILNYSNGSFIASQSRLGFYIKNGEAYYVNNVKIISDIFKFLKNISGISKLSQWTYNDELPYPVLSPYILLEEIHVTV